MKSHVTVIPAIGFIEAPEDHILPTGEMLANISLAGVDLTPARAVRINGRWFEPSTDPSNPEVFNNRWQDLVSGVPIIDS